MPSIVTMNVEVLSVPVEEALLQIEAKAIVSEDGQYILTEDGQPIIEEDNT